MENIKVNHQFEKDDGTLGTRSTFDDGMSLPRRIFIRMKRYLKGDEGDTLIIPGVNAYNCGEYEEAHKWFIKAVELHPDLQPELAPHIDACNRVIRTTKDREDILYEEVMAKWDAKAALLKRFLKGPRAQVRCKYCGHYTPYLDPPGGPAFHAGNH